MMALVLPVTAHAGWLYTSPLYADSGQSYHACNVANVSTALIEVDIEIKNSAGLIIVNAPTIFLNPGTSTELQTNETYSGFAYCRITLAGEAKSTVRANLAVLHYTGSFFDTLAISEAR
jgi:hypothetical protein